MEISRSNESVTLDDSFRTELLSPAAQAVVDHSMSLGPTWKLNTTDFHLPQLRSSDHQSFSFLRLLRAFRNQKKVAEYYKKQERLLEGFNEMDTINECGYLPGNLTEDEMKQHAKSERMAIHASNIANMVLFIAKVYASIDSRSLAVISSTLDSLLDLLSGFILWFTSHAMKTPNQYRYPIGKKRMQPVGIVVFASVMATLGLQILFESGKELITKE
nr:metal tolerance protein 10-like [Nicotiana tomentosiformis]